MLDAADRPLTFLRFGIQRKKQFLKDVRDAYDGLVLPANILLYQYRSTPSAVFMTDKPYFTDPMSYLFGQPYEHFKKRVTEGQPRFKPSFQKLMERHGLDPEDFSTLDYKALLRFLNRSRENAEKFTVNTLGFQWDQVWEVMRNSTELMTDEQREALKEESFRPRFLVPPYFLYAEEEGGGDAVTNRLNDSIVEVAWGYRDQWTDIFPMLFLQRQGLTNSLRDRAISSVTRQAFPGYCLWIDGFDERRATKREVRSLIGITERLSADGRQVVMLRGGFFSLLLKYFGMTCVCHGLLYGEASTADASAKQAAGPPLIRYYIRDLHSFLTLDNALIVLRARPDLLCDCEVCRRLLRGDPERVTLFANEEEFAEMHFLYCRDQERKEIGKLTLAEAVDSLDVVLGLNDDLTAITRRYRTGTGFEERAIIDPQYIREWKEALQERVT